MSGFRAFRPTVRRGEKAAELAMQPLPPPTTKPARAAGRVGLLNQTEEKTANHGHRNTDEKDGFAATTRRPISPGDQQPRNGPRNQRTKERSANSKVVMRPPPEENVATSTSAPPTKPALTKGQVILRPSLAQTAAPAASKSAPRATQPPETRDNRQTPVASVYVLSRQTRTSEPALTQGQPIKAAEIAKPTQPSANQPPKSTAEPATN